MPDTFQNDLNDLNDQISWTSLLKNSKMAHIEPLLDYLHAEDGEYQVQHSQEHHGDHLHAEKLDKVQHNTEKNGDHFHVEKDKNQVKPNPEHHLLFHAGENHEDRVKPPPSPEQHVYHLHEEEGNVQVQINPKHHDGHLQKKVKIESNSP